MIGDVWGWCWKNGKGGLIFARESVSGWWLEEGRRRNSNSTFSQLPCKLDSTVYKVEIKNWVQLSKMLKIESEYSIQKINIHLNLFLYLLNSALLFGVNKCIINTCIFYLHNIIIINITYNIYYL